jgi:hypothetical protein
MTIQTIRKKFNTLGSRWAFTGPLASKIHAMHMGTTTRNVIRTLDVVVRRGNREKFYEALTSLGLEFRPEKSSRKVLYFSARGKGLSVTLTLSDDMPRHMTYDGITPIVSLNALPKTSNVRHMVNFVSTVKRIAHMNNIN